MALSFGSAEEAMRALGSSVGQQLGVASGAIRIDTSGAEQAATTVRKVGQDMQQSLGGTGLGGVKALGQGLQSLRGELVAVSAAAGLLTKIGLDSAQSMRAYKAAFTGVLGDQQQSVLVMEQLTQKANEFGMEVAEAWQLGRMLLPVLQDGAKSLDDWVSRAARLSTLNPQFASQAARSVIEFLSGNIVTLQRVFNIPQSLIHEAQGRFTDLGDQLDYILEKMGATEEAARAMADPFVAVRNEVKLLLATGFTPLLNTVRPLLTDLREFLSGVRETAPGVLALAAAVASIAAVGAPSLLLLTQMLSTAQKLKALGLDWAGIAGALGKGGVIAGAAVAGGAIGMGIVRGVGGATGNEGYAGYSLAQLWEQVRQAIGVLFYALSRWSVTFQEALGRAGEGFINALAGLQGAIGRFESWLGGLLPSWAGGDLLEASGAARAKSAEQLRELADWVGNMGQRSLVGQDEALRKIFGMLGLQSQQAAAAAPATTSGGETLPTDTIQKWADDVRKIEADAAQARLDATQQYEQQRTEMIAGYELTIARDAEDFARQRAREEQQLQASIAGVRADAAEREAEAQADLQEKLGDLRGDSAKRIEEAERSYQSDMERLQRDHRISLMEAAARLDAQAVADEQRRYRDQSQDMATDLQERTAKERENLAERIAQEQEAHEERLQDQRQADERRIRDMTDSLREQQRLEDEDRRIRLSRMAEDHRRQLQQLEQANAQRLAQINRQAAQERQLLDWNFIQQLAQEGKQSQSWLALQSQRQAASLALFNQFWSGVDAMVRSRMPSPPTTGSRLPPEQVPQPFQHGGPAPYTGLAMLHGTPARPEYVLSPDTTDVLRRMLGGGFSQARLVGAVAGGGGRSLSIGSIVIPDAGNPKATARAVRRELTALFEEMA